jgi:transposase
MKAYSEDLRRKVVEGVHRGTGKSEAARSFGVSLSSVKRYVAKADQGGSLSPRKHPGPRSELDERARRLLEVDVEERPALSLRERGRFLERVAARDAEGYFEHRGYRLVAQQLCDKRSRILSLRSRAGNQ